MAAGNACWEQEKELWYGYEGVDQPSGKFQKQVSFCKSVKVTEYRIALSAMSVMARSRHDDMGRRLKTSDTWGAWPRRGGHGKEERRYVLSRTLCRLMRTWNVTSDKSSGDDDEEICLCHLERSMSRSTIILTLMIQVRISRHRYRFRWSVWRCYD